MTDVSAYAALGQKKPLAPHTITRREPRAHDVEIDIAYSGVCHSDIHQARDEWGGATFPMVPGHEIVGRVRRVGDAVKRLAKGDLVGVGCMVDACRVCPSCAQGQEQYCADGPVWTYNSAERHGGTPTYGGYSTRIVVDEAFVLTVAESLAIEGTAPLLCAGITMYSPLRHWKVEAGQRVGIVGLGGLGHMGVKLAAAMGAEVTVFSSSEKKRADAARLGASALVVATDDRAMAKLGKQFDLVIDTVSAPHDLGALVRLVKKDGSLVLVGIPDKPLAVPAFGLVGARRSLAGSLIGGIRETQEMLDFCAAKSIVADVEVIAMKEINVAYDRMLKSDVRYRFVIDTATMS